MNLQREHEKLLSWFFVWADKQVLMQTNPGGGQHGSCLSCFPRTAPVSGSTARQAIVAMLMILTGHNVDNVDNVENVDNVYTWEGLL